MGVQAGLAGLLTRLGAGTDIPLGVPVADRADPALEELVGFFVNTVVLRADTGGDPGFGELLRRVKEASVAAYQHQDLPFEQLVEILNPARAAAYHPLFQTSLSIDNAAGARLRLAGVRARAVPLAPVTAKFDLTISLAEHHTGGGVPAGMTGALTYRTDLYSHDTATALAARLTRLIATAATHPHTPLHHLDILTGRERGRLLGGWGNRARPGPPGTLTRRFAAQVARHPDAVAVRSDAGTLTYRQLSEQAARLATRLADRGAGPHSPVALLLSRSAYQVIAPLAVLMAGAAYLPVPEQYPPSLRARVIAAAGARLLVTDSGRAGPELPAGLDVIVADARPGARRGPGPPRPGTRTSSPTSCTRRGPPASPRA